MFSSKFVWNYTRGAEMDQNPHENKLRNNTPTVLQ